MEESLAPQRDWLDVSGRALTSVERLNVAEALCTELDRMRDFIQGEHIEELEGYTFPEFEVNTQKDNRRDEPVLNISVRSKEPDADGMSYIFQIGLHASDGQLHNILHYASRYDAKGVFVDQDGYDWNGNTCLSTSVDCGPHRQAQDVVSHILTEIANLAADEPITVLDFMAKEYLENRSRLSPLVESTLS